MPASTIGLFAYLDITQDFYPFVVAAVEKQEKEDLLRQQEEGQQHQKKEDLLQQKEDGQQHQKKDRVRLLRTIKLRDEFNKTCLPKIIFNAEFQSLIPPHKITAISDAVLCEYRVTFKSALFAVIIPLSMEGDLQVTVKGPEGEEFEMDWRICSMIVISRKCDLRVNGPGKLIGVVIVFLGQDT